MGSRWVGWGRGRVDVAVAGGRATHVSDCAWLIGRGNIPEVDMGASCCNNAGWGGDGCCTPVAMESRVVAAGRSLFCCLAVAKIAAEVAGIVRSLRCMEVVLGWLAGEGESPAIRRSSRLLPCWMLYGNGIVDLYRD